MTEQMLWQFNEFVQQSMDDLVAKLNTMEPTPDYNARCVGVVHELCHHCLRKSICACPLLQEEHGRDVSPIQGSFHTLQGEGL